VLDVEVVGEDPAEVIPAMLTDRRSCDAGPEFVIVDGFNTLGVTWRTSFKRGRIRSSHFSVSTDWWHQNPVRKSGIDDKVRRATWPLFYSNLMYFDLELYLTEERKL
jgi:hypothetical protein